jgi:hypothetical protein
MGPLSLTFGIAGLLPLVATAINCARDYSHAVLNAKDTIATLISELEKLQFSVSELHEFLKSRASDDLRFQHASVLVSCCTACNAKLHSLCEKLEQKAGGRNVKYLVLWPFSEKEHKKTLQELRNFTTWMHFALSIDGCRLLSRTSDDLLKVLGQQLEQFQDIQLVKADVAQLSTAVEGQRAMLEKSAADDARNKVLDWISTAKYYQKHQALQASRAKNAGDWVLHSPEYVRWRDGETWVDAVLWGQGIQGSGKTNLV